MKQKHIVPTDKERVMRADDFIVSKTDLTGRITYGNRIFIEFSGYSEEELIGTQHNIIRHPDMPRAVFQLLWDTIEAGNEIFAYVKNMSKDGGYYWVFANATPSYDKHGNMVGYYSVRRKPNPKAVEVVAGLYKVMLEAEQKAGPKDAIAASTKILLDTLEEKGLTYEQLIFALEAS